MLPAFVIHHSAHSERDEVVKQIQEKTKAITFEAHILPDRVRGCLFSHIGVAKLARSLYPTSSYLVFEDDCELSDDWDKLLADVSGVDVCWLGYTDKCDWATFGTHALVLSPRARDLVIEKACLYGKDTFEKNAYDHILSKMAREEGLKVAMPPYDRRKEFCRQKKGLVSTITGRVRD